MAALQSIRNHGTILLIVVGVAMLAFILGDFLSSGSTIFNRNRDKVATIAGHKVSYEEYNNAIEQFTFAYEQQGNNSEDLNYIVRNDVWQSLLTKYALEEQAEAIGMVVTDNELSNYIFQTYPHLAELVTALEQEPTTPEEETRQNQLQAYWNHIEKQLYIEYLSNKYTGLFSNMMTANNLDAKYAFNSSKETVDVQYVQQPYYAVADEVVTVTENDIKSLYEQKKNAYKQTLEQRNRTIEYVSIPINPSNDDIAETEAFVNSILDDFQTKEDVSSIINSYSSIKFNGDYSIETIPAEYKDFAFRKDVKKDDCTELTFNDYTYSIARVIECGYNKPDSVNLIALAGGQVAEDQAIGWIKAQDLLPEIAEPAFNGKAGEEFAVTLGENEQKFRIEEISPATPKVKVAILSIKVNPSAATYESLLAKARQFAATNNNATALHKAAINEGYSTTPAKLLKNSYKVEGLGNSHDIAKWAFTAQQGQVSSVYTCGEQYVVAALTQINDGEYASLESVRDAITREAINNKKAEYIIKQLKDVNTLEAAAQLFETEIKSETGVSLSNDQFGTSGLIEPAVIGTALSLEANKVSAPVKGTEGVYLLCVSEKTMAEGEFNAEQEIANLNFYKPYYVPAQLMNYTTEKVAVEDNRAQFQN